MLTVLAGTPGSCKSLDAVEIIIQNLKSGSVVYTNIEGMDKLTCRAAIKALTGLDDYEFTKRFVWLPDNHILRYWEYCKMDSLIVIDECHLIISNREWNTDKNKDFAAKASTHRHDGYDIL